MGAADLLLWLVSLLALMPLANVITRMNCGDCGGCGCPICEDDFNRSDGTDINTGSPCGWAEDSGTWTIESGRLKIVSSSGRARCTTAHPDGTATCKVTVDFEAATAGDVIRVYVDYVDLSHFHRVQITAGSCLDVSAVVLGTPAQYAAATMTDMSGTLVVCYDEATGVLRATVGSVSVSTVSASQGGDKVVLSTGTIAAPVYFDNFKFEYGYDATLHPSCPQCNPITTGGGCSLGSDDFTRADSSNIGCQWTEQAGASEIASNKLKITGANSRNRFNQPNNDSGAMTRSPATATATRRDSSSV